MQKYMVTNLDAFEAESLNAELQNHICRLADF